MKRALVIAHEPDGPARQIETRLTERGIECVTHIVTHDYDAPNVAEPWPDATEFDLLIVMGSIRSITRKHEIDSWLDTELDMIRTAHRTGQPVLGVCFGGQLIAEALGGSVETSPVTEIGWFEIRSAVDVENPAGPGPWMEWHHDRFVPPVEAQVLAENENAIQLFRVGRSVGTQFHPEVDVDHITDWLATCDDDYLAEHGQTRQGLLDAVAVHEQANIKQCHAFVDWFLDEVACLDQPVEAQT